ncbi:replication endonuclease [Halomonas sp. NO4]|uniref:replication endonuclease n=1 Tax=Halomonas sp. NO4 TaxID=2484813 RepID=UPI0013D7852F|nr:replication endonuclease [Halomonas sp. NO4]
MTSHAAAVERQAVADALLRCGPWYCTHDDEAIISHAERQADEIARIRARGGDAAALDAAARRCAAHGIALPDTEGERGQIARLACPLWWRRQIRRLNARRLEQQQRVLGRVHDRAGIYVSDEGYRARRRQVARNARLLEAVAAVNELGQEYTLAELAEVGLANPNNRRAELMLRIADTEAEAIRLGHVGLFVTLTCPSRFHAVWRGTARQNPKWEGAERPDPRQAQAHLQNLWARARAKLGREGIGIYGIRVVEPHHDGCPHWHLLMWCEPDNAPAVTAILRAYALEDSPEEVARRPGDTDAKAAAREQVRFKPVTIDTARGSAAGYVAKYISKNINGEQFERGAVDGDHLDAYGHDLTSSAPRIEAWASTWGIRQFQFFGLPSVTVWRQARRIRDAADLLQWMEERDPDAAAVAVLGRIWKAADSGDWAGYLREMGGPMTKRADQPARPWRILRHTGRGDGELQTGAYGEPVESPLGIVVHGVECLTQRHRWETRRRAPGDSREGLTFAAAGGAWTRVNNCTPAPPGPRAATFTGRVFGPKSSPLSEWEWHVTESYRRMKPPIPRPEVERIQRQAALDAAAYYRAADLHRLEREDAARHRELIDEGEAAVVRMLARGEITPTQAREALT